MCLFVKDDSSVIVKALKWVLFITEAVDDFVMCIADACQVLAKFTMRLCHIGIPLTRVKLVLTPGVQLGNGLIT